MINFTNCIEEINRFSGKDLKKTLIYNDKRYLVKFSAPIVNNKYINNVFSEYIGSNIFRIIGFEVQNTLLGTYKYKDKEKIVCACLDFTNESNILYEFENLALSTNPEKKIDTELSDILDVLEEAKNIIDIEDVKSKFFDMFIVDSLIGNTDRHNGNWGFLFNKVTKAKTFSPIYDCGSCLNPMLEDDELIKLDNNELNNLAVNCFSCLKINDKRINYMSYIKSMCNEEVNKALIRVMKKIDINKINDFIDGIECISKERAYFYKFILNERYLILKSTYNKLNK